MEVILESTKKTVVYIDDERDLVKLVCLMLGHRGYEVIGATGGREGLEVIRRVRPDVVLLDLMMPDMSGDQVFHQMQNDEALKHIPVVITTADAAHKTRTRCEQLLNADGFVLKPFSSKELTDTIERAIPSATGGAFCEKAGKTGY